MERRNKRRGKARHQRLTSVILAIWRQRSGISKFKVSLGKKFMRPYLNQ
jgi:hypothetical protein